MKHGARIVTFRAGKPGREYIDYHNNHEPVARDATVAQLMPKEVRECSLARNGEMVCIRRKVLQTIARGICGRDSEASLSRPASRSARSSIETQSRIARSSIETQSRIARSSIETQGRADSSDVALMRELMRETGCTTERCVLHRARDMRIITPEEAGLEEILSFKIEGPTDVTLFSDSIIDTQLYAWMYQWETFWAYNFNMLDFREKCLRNSRVVDSPDTLWTINWRDLYEGRVPDPVNLKITPIAREMLDKKRAVGIRCSACVINTDYYDGPGKHWMALFVDARGDDLWTIEFFNSAAVRPRAEWLEYMSKTRAELSEVARDHGLHVRIEYRYVCDVWHQHSNTECGPYSLFYIWARLNGIDSRYFMENPVPDQLIFEFRQHLFNDHATSVGKPFNFREFARNVRIKWDHE